MSESNFRSPYQGLIPYDEEDAPFFFGREKETRLIAANLFAAPLTLLYGASGVGKSSVLRAGVVHQLRPREDLLLVVFSAWQGDSVNELKTVVADAAGRIGSENVPSPDSAPLAEYLAECAARLDRRVMIILDQFEEYFLYHPEDDTFSAEFPHALMQTDVPVSFLISLREDSLAKLDRFEGRIPNLFDNYLRVEHLGREAARAAIEKPIEQYNRLRARDDGHVTAESGLVEAVLQQVRTGQVIIGQAGRGAVETATRPTPGEVQIETPYLQLVMTRLWKEEIDAGSHVLRLETLNRLGGAERIVRTHLDGVMDALLSSHQNVAARVFHHLVTPGGTKIAHIVPDLADYAGLPQSQIAPVLEKLSGAEIRILRPVAPPPDQPAVRRYEIFHDVLAPAILDWRSRYLYKLESKRQRNRSFVLVGIIILSSVATYLGYAAWRHWNLWGYLRNLSTGSVHELTENLATIGRSTRDVRNAITLVPRTISRRHLEIEGKTLVATDLRSRNGTTINAKFLHYGNSVRIKDGDIIVLAGIAPFHFWTDRRKDARIPSGWGMLIDGRTRTIMYMDEEQYFLSLDEQNRIILQNKETDDALLTIRRHKDQRIGIVDRDDGVDLLGTMKEGDYQYPQYHIPPGREFSSFKTERESHDLFEIAYSYKGVRFQIVRIVPNLEPPAASR